ncbi:MAG: cupin domain-containing protein [Acidobacteriota bacterium]
MKTTDFENSRRAFLRSAPAAAAAVTVADLLLPALAMAQSSAPLNQQNFLVVSAAELDADIKTLAALSGPAHSRRLFNDKNFLIDLWVEKKNAGKEFEWHEHRDHIIQILDGSTEYEVGGKPQGAHSTGPGEWLAPHAEGATKYTLKKGDWLIIRRGTLHKRTTREHVTFTLTAPQTA